MPAQLRRLVRFSLGLGCLLGLLAASPAVVPPRAASAADTYVLYLPVVARACTPPDIPTSGNWLEYLNYYRATACEPAVTENAAWSDGDVKHGRYIVKNDIVEHDEDPANRWYTPEGRAAAQASDLTSSYNVNETDVWAIDSWMQAPFHAVGALDPRVTQVGYGSYREADGNLQMGAGLNVIAGLDYGVVAHYPVFWPGNGTTVPIRLHWGEIPSPLTACPGYTAPSGLPVVVQFESSPAVTASSFAPVGGAPLEHCVFDAKSYTYPDPAWQSTARSILRSRSAVVLIPRAPLTAGQTYRVSLTNSGTTYTWSFSVSSTPHVQPNVTQAEASWVR